MDSLRAAYLGVVANRMRTLLTTASVAVGVCAVVTLGSTARSGLATLTQGLERIGGARLVAIFSQPSGGPRAAYARPLSDADVKMLRAAIPQARWISSQAFLGEGKVRWRGRESFAPIVASDSHIASLFQLELAAGRRFADSEMVGGPRVALIAYSLAVQLFDRPPLALGQPIHVDGKVHTVVGVLAPHSSNTFNLGYDIERVVLLPLNDASTDPSLILIATRSRSDNARITAAATSLLGVRRHGANNFRVFDFAVLMDEFEQMLRTVELFASAIAAIALLAGGAGTINVLLVSLNEQIREIGIRKALGAPASVLMQQFVLQALMIAAAGTAGGLLLGLAAVFGGGTIVSNHEQNWVAVAAPGPILFAVATAFGVTVLASLFPAFSARRLKVIDCLRAQAC